MTSILSLAGGQPADTGFYPHKISQSLRFEDSDNAYLSRTPAQPGNRDAWALSMWVKRSQVGVRNKIFGAGASFPTNHDNAFYMWFQADDTLRIKNEASGAEFTRFDTTRVFRDLSAWYHIVYVYDSGQAVSTDRQSLYINGVKETVFDVVLYPTQDQNSRANTTNSHYIGITTAVDPYEGYMSAITFIDGLALTADSFGEVKEGIWVPKDVSGLAYGTNGYHLDFADSSAIGNDVSGQNNDWTTSGIVASDVVLDSPTNNFATFNALDNIGTSAFSEGNLKVGSTTATAQQKTRSTIAMSQDFYFEACKLDGGTQNFNVGIATATAAIGNTGNTGVYTKGNSGGIGDVLMYAYSASANALWTGLNGTWDNSATVAEIEAGTTTNATHTSIADEPVAAVYIDQANSYSGRIVANFGQDSSFANNKTSGSAGASDANGQGDFYYSPPAGFIAMCSANLPEPEIIDGSEYFNTVLYTGNGGTQDIDTGLTPDWVWIKSRSDSYEHVVYDTVRGATKRLQPSTTQAEVTSSTAVTAFNSSSFSLGAGASSNLNNATYASWNWKAGGTAVSNTSGSTASNVSANTDAGFSIVTWFANAATGTVGHGLNSAPELVIAKPRDDSGTNWYVMHTDALTASQVVNLDSNTAAFTPGVAHFNSTYPTSSVISYGGYMGNALTNNNKLAYCFHSVEGFSKAGMYIGNSSADGTYVNTGFKVAWLMVKDRDNTGSWYIWDNKRSAHNEMNDRLVADLTAGEVADREVDFLSNGFKLRESNIAHNGSGREYIYLAFAEQPFKYANAR